MVKMNKLLTKELTLMKHFLDARHCSKCFAHYLFNCQDNSVE